MESDSRLDEIEQKLRTQGDAIVGLKKEISVLRRQLRSSDEVPHGEKECRFGLGDDCPRAGTYQYQQGCRGTACSTARSAYYNKKQQDTVVEQPRKRMIRRAAQ